MSWIRFSVLAGQALGAVMINQQPMLAQSPPPLMYPMMMPQAPQPPPVILVTPQAAAPANAGLSATELMMLMGAFSHPQTVAQQVVVPPAPMFAPSQPAPAGAMARPAGGAGQLGLESQLAAAQSESRMLKSQANELQGKLDSWKARGSHNGPALGRDLEQMVSESIGAAWDTLESIAISMEKKNPEATPGLVRTQLEQAKLKLEKILSSTKQTIEHTNDAHNMVHLASSATRSILAVVSRTFVDLLGIHHRPRSVEPAQDAGGPAEDLQGHHHEMRHRNKAHDGYHHEGPPGGHGGRTHHGPYPEMPGMHPHMAYPGMYHPMMHPHMAHPGQTQAPAPVVHVNVQAPAPVAAATPATTTEVHHHHHHHHAPVAPVVAEPTFEKAPAVHLHVHAPPLPVAEAPKALGLGERRNAATAEEIAAGIPSAVRPNPRIGRRGADTDVGANVAAVTAASAELEEEEGEPEVALRGNIRRGAEADIEADTAAALAGAKKKKEEELAAAAAAAAKKKVEEESGSGTDRSPVDGEDEDRDSADGSASAGLAEVKPGVAVGAANKKGGSDDDESAMVVQGTVSADELEEENEEEDEEHSQDLKDAALVPGPSKQAVTVASIAPPIPVVADDSADESAFEAEATNVDKAAIGGGAPQTQIVVKRKTTILVRK